MFLIYKICLQIIQKYSCQAILLPFAHREKADGTDGASGGEGMDREELRFEQELAELEADGKGNLVGDEDPPVDDDNDELAPDVVISDASAVNDIVSEVELNDRLPSLDNERLKHGRMAITKVCISLISQ